MALPSTIHTLPYIGRAPDNVTFSLMSNTTSFQSPIGGTTQTLEVPGAYWTGSVNYRNLTFEQAKRMKGFLVSLKGQAGRFWMGDMSYRSPSLTNTWSIIGVTNRSTVTLRAFPEIARFTPVFKAGDYIAFRYAKDTATNLFQSLHMITEDEDYASGNRAIVRFTPNLRVLPTLSVGSPVAYTNMNYLGSTGLTNANAVSVFRLETDTVAWNVRPPNFTSLQFSFVEAF